MKHWKRTLGFTIWGVAIIGWIMPLVIPFTSLSLETKIITITVAIIVAEVSFIVGGVLLGSQYKDRIRGMLRFKKPADDSSGNKD